MTRLTADFIGKSLNWHQETDWPTLVERYCKKRYEIGSNDILKIIQVEINELAIKSGVDTAEMRKAVMLRNEAMLLRELPKIFKKENTAIPYYVPPITDLMHELWMPDITLLEMTKKFRDLSDEDKKKFFVMISSREN